MLARTPSGSLASMTWNSIVRRRSSTSSSVDPGDSPTSRPVTATPSGERSPMGMATMPGRSSVPQMEHAQGHVPGAAGDLGKDRRRQQREGGDPGQERRGARSPRGLEAAVQPDRDGGGQEQPQRQIEGMDAAEHEQVDGGQQADAEQAGRAHGAIPTSASPAWSLRASSGSGHRPTASTTTATTATTARALAGAGRTSGWGRQNWCW